MSNFLNWNELGAWNGSKQLGFGELCWQLAGAEDTPEGAKFVRKGTPDTGVGALVAMSQLKDKANKPGFARKFEARSSKSETGRI